MSETRGVFGIFDIVNSKLDDQWVSLDDVWITVGISTTRFLDGADGHSGYFGGGGQLAARSTMEKVTYSSDTTAEVPGAFLSIGSAALAASSAGANALPDLAPPAATPTPQTYNGSPINV